MTKHSQTDTVGSDRPPLSVELSRPRKRPSMFEPPTGRYWDVLPEKEKIAKLRVIQEECLRKEREIIRLIKLRNLMPTRQLPKGVLSEAATLFSPQKIRKKKKGNLNDISHRWLQQLMKQYQEYRSAYPYDPGAEFFMPLPMGRPTGQSLTDDQMSVIRYALIERSRHIISAHGKIREIDVPFIILDVHNYAKTIDPSLPSYDTTRRYIRSFAERYPALFKRITEGEDFVKRELLLKKRNDVLRPNQRWQSDGADLPWYVIHKGKVCRVCILIVYDDYTGYIVWWKLIIKEETDQDVQLKKLKVNKNEKQYIKTKTRKPRSTTFTAEDVVSLLLTAMYLTGVIPEEIYVDNGSQYIKAQRLMENLRNGTGDAIIWRHTRPWEPWGRGKIEGKIGKLRYFLTKVSGTYKKNNRRSISIARKCTNLYTYEEAVDELAKHFADLNERARKRAPSRFTLWQSVSSLRAPSIHQMTTVNGVDVVQKLVTLDDWSISFNGDEWEPKSIEGQNRKIYRLLADAIANDEKTWLSAIKLDIGWKVEVQLHGEWIEFVRKSTQQGDAQHNMDQAAMLKDLREDQRIMHEADLDVVKRIVKALPIQEAATGEYILPSTPQADISSYPDTASTERIPPIDLDSTQGSDTHSEQADKPKGKRSSTSKSQSKSQSKTKTHREQTKKRDDSTSNALADTNMQQPDSSDIDEDLAGLPDFAKITEQIKSRMK